MMELFRHDGGHAFPVIAAGYFVVSIENVFHAEAFLFIYDAALIL